MKEKRGITLIALVVTIVILLILATVTINTTVGNSGIFARAKEAKTKSEIAKENDTVSTAYASAQTYENNIGKVTKENLQKEMDELTGSGKTTVTGEGPFKVTYNESGRSYNIGATKYSVGDYVTYTPTSSSYTITGANVSSGGKISDKTLTTETLKWRIYSIDDNGNIQIISETPSTQTIGFQGGNAINNGVYYLNNTCKALYSSNIGTARSIKIEDIENVIDSSKFNYATRKDQYTNKEGVTFLGYNGNSYTFKVTSNIKQYYPAIFTKEYGAKIDDVDTNGTLKPSEQYEIITGAAKNATKNITSTNNSWSNIKEETKVSDTSVQVDIPFINSNYTDILINHNGNKLFYYLATRTCDGETNSSGFDRGIRIVYAGYVNYKLFYYSNEGEDSEIEQANYRPIVEIKAGSNIGNTGDGTSSNPWSIE